MKAKIFFLTLIVSLLLNSCSTVEKRDVVINNNEFVIPFDFGIKGNYYLPVIRVKAHNNKTLSLGIDTGFNKSVIFNSGLSKIVDINELRKVSYENFKNVYSEEKGVAKDSISESEYKEAYKISTYGEYITTNLTLDPLMFSNINLEYSFHGRFDGYDTEGIDGMIGFDFFGKVQNISIDYHNKTVTINKNISSNKQGALMKYDSFTKLYQAEVLINGHKEDILLDTGAETVVLREGFGTGESSIDPIEVSNFIDNGEVVFTEPKDIPVAINIGNEEIKINNAVLYSNSSGEAPPKVIRLLYFYNTMGYTVFKDRCITFDFENSLFIIE